MRCAESSSSVKQWALCASSTHDVQHAIVGVNVVIGVLVVHCELLVVRVVPLAVCDVAIFHIIFAVLEVSMFTHTQSVTCKLLLDVTEF